LRVIVEPLVPWIWFGGFIVCLGAVISIAPTSRRAVASAPAAERPGEREVPVAPGRTVAVG
jgi:cytochrome c biogenesis factor